MQTTDFLGNSWNHDCMGRAIANQSMKVPGGIIQRTKYLCVHQDPLIPLPGFLVIASLRHIQSIAEMHDTEYSEFALLVKTTHHAIKSITKLETLTLVQEESSAHFHFWFFPWTQAVLAHYGQPSLTKIRDIMNNLKKEKFPADQWNELKKTIERIKTLTTETLRHGAF